MEPIEKFNAHLDLCDQCRLRPHELCEVGAKLLVAAATGSPTGRLPTEPRMQQLPMRTELGRDLRDSLMRVLGGDGELESKPPPVVLNAEGQPRPVARLLGTNHFVFTDVEPDRSCPACEAGIPKTKAPRQIHLPYGATLKKV